ncbi:hypothetical protein TthAA37_03050 [Thermus thermophilus]|nr:hypothetical protein TthAA37_03050 [Thermus thermophilus]
MKLTLDQLRYLVALAEEGSFTRAAERVYLTQPALSVQIRKLEETLGTRLFDRKKGTLTEAGRVAVAQARRVLEEVERLKLLVQGEEACFQGSFRLGVIPTLAPYLLPRLLPELKARYPRLSLTVREELTPGIVRGLEEGSLDAGLVGTEERHPGLGAEPLFTEAFWAYVAPGHPLFEREAVHPLEIPLESRTPGSSPRDTASGTRSSPCAVRASAGGPWSSKAGTWRPWSAWWTPWGGSPSSPRWPSGPSLRPKGPGCAP